MQGGRTSGVFVRVAGPFRVGIDVCFWSDYPPQWGTSFGKKILKSCLSLYDKS